MTKQFITIDTSHRRCCLFVCLLFVCLCTSVVLAVYLPLTHDGDGGRNNDNKKIEGRRKKEEGNKEKKKE
jgi:hypothetical protein